MAKYRFRFSDMVPNAWFWKLKDMAVTTSSTTSTVRSNRTRKQKTPVAANSQESKPKQPHHSYPRKSYYYTRELASMEPKGQNDSSPTNPKSSGTEPPRKSSKHGTKKRSLMSPNLVSSSVSSGCACRATLWTKPDSPPDHSASLSDSFNDQEFCYVFPPEFRCDHVLTTDSSIDKMVSLSSCNLDSTADKKVDLFEKISDLDLPPIITKPLNLDHKTKDTKCRRNPPAKCQLQESADGSFSVKIVKEKRVTPKEQKHFGSVRKISVNSPGVRLRVNSPKVAASKRVQARRSYQRGLSDSLAIVKSSLDPQKDFRESMVEMILENNIKASKDLEDLLACYLSLNSDEYHELIIKVFKQIWFDLTQV
ncbi:hypothetical protein K2173_000157 [Erythroxylum novogranatense]|uniref:Transcription repressor n=1 Tax=Erythroxylum novogranatense TaxID=1862640 RepID=A0AAV8SPK1_9ROSI|nr:hypothetical protein K2173_000157 [Erythroxylum novogranatense]